MVRYFARAFSHAESSSGNSIAYYQALTKAGVPVSLHVYPTGGHGFGFSTGFPAHDQMTEELSAWLKALAK